MQRPWPSDHLARDGGNPAPYSHFLYSLRLIIRVDGKKPGLIDCTKRNWENSCSLCFLQVMRLIRGARIITNFRGSFPAVGDRPCRQIFFGNYNRGLYCLPMPIHSAFSFSGPDFRQFDRDLRCTPAGDEDVRPAAGIKNVRFLPDMPEIHRSICQGSLLLDDPIRRISVSGLGSRAVLQLSINGRGPPHTFPHKDNCNFSPFGIC